MMDQKKDMMRKDLRDIIWEIKDLKTRAEDVLGAAKYVLKKLQDMEEFLLEEDPE